MIILELTGSVDFSSSGVELDVESAGITDDASLFGKVMNISA